MPPITRGHFRTREIWIDDALCRAARCRRVALRQRRVAAFVIVGPRAVHMQANRISRIVRRGPSRHCRQNRRDGQNRQSRNAHQSLLRDMRGSRSGPGRIFRSQAGRSLCSQSIHVRALGQAEYCRASACRRAQYCFAGRNVRCVHQRCLGAVHVEYLADQTLFYGHPTWSDSMGISRHKPGNRYQRRDHAGGEERGRVDRGRVLEEIFVRRPDSR